MAGKISAEELRSTLEGETPFALIDVREPAEYNSSHIPGSSLIPRRLLEFQMAAAVPYNGAQVVLCDDDERRAALAAATLERMGYSHVSVLDGGINRWVSRDHPKTSAKKWKWYTTCPRSMQPSCTDGRIGATSW